jgi:hypothetical protein
VPVGGNAVGNFTIEQMLAVRDINHDIKSQNKANIVIRAVFSDG